MTITTTKFNTLTTGRLYQILQLREKVFVLEQACLYKDLDDIDQRSFHSYIEMDGKIAAYARTYWKDESKKIAQIGRVVVDPDYRRKRYGSNIMHTGIEIAVDRLQADWVYIEAQVYAIPFYERLGFKVTSEEFLEDGIPHVQMMLELQCNTKPLSKRAKCPECGSTYKNLRKYYDGEIMCLKCYHRFTQN